MNRTATALVTLACLGAVARGDEAAAPAGGPGGRLIGSFPRFDPEANARRQLDRAAGVAAPDEGEVVVLPELTVLERAKEKMAEHTLYTKGAFDEELVKRELSEFDRYFLNRIRIPLLSVSNAVRAREAYLARRKRESDQKIRDLAEVVAVTDPEEAKAMRGMLRDHSRAGQPANVDHRPVNWR